MSSRPRWRVRMCLTMARPRPVPFICAARADIDPVEALGQARQVLGRNARAVILHFDQTQCGRSLARLQPDVHLASRRAVADARSPSGSAPAAPVRRGRRRPRAARPARRCQARRECSAASGCMASPTCLRTATRSTWSVGRLCARISHATSDRRSSISRRIRRAWSSMTFRNFSDACRIVARRPEQRLDKAGQRGERRPQLMAGIGDEIGAHAGDGQPVGDVVEGDEHEADCLRPAS